MVMVYTPTYFDKKYPYCAREYRAMEELERQRLALLPNREERKYGLIIPVIFRGEQFLPAVIKAQRQYYSFNDVTPGKRQLLTHRRYAPYIKKIAEYIAARCYSLEQLGDDVCKNCEDFQLPAEETILQWLADLRSPRLQFPGHEGNL